ncbi:hypothetical protein [uncultured Kordia sp.]|uniref:hypothetical protein n=1 Tax=uncultured Kordia sp. TaxID=507699 RepID=UPI00260D6BC4|nr:hypothetical protein [uncultured Kordia sp.]
MKKVLLCIMAFAMLSCSSDDENSSITEENAISFNLNGTDYSLTDYSVQIDPTNSWNRIIEASFDNNTKRILFFVEVEETNQIGEFLFQIDGINWISDPTLGNRETSITTHTDTKMEGTFRVTFEDTRGKPVYAFTNGEINIQY